MKRQNLRTVSLIVVTFTYLLIGAAIFGYLESEHEVRQRENLELIELIVKRKYNISDDDFTVLTTTVIKSVPHKAGIQWKFPGAFYFATTVVTTIGYGHSTPATMAGRSFCMIYALIGIPLGLVMFQSIGERLNTFVGSALKYTKRCFKAKNPEVTQTNLVMVVSVLSTILMTSMAAVFAKYERWEYFDALYYCFITLTTIGFGDYVALQKESALQSKPEYVALSLIFILFGLSVVSSAVNLLVLKFLTLNTEDERRDEQLRYTANLNPILLEGDVITHPSGAIQYTGPQSEQSKALNLPPTRSETGLSRISSTGSSRTGEQQAVGIPIGLGLASNAQQQQPAQPWSTNLNYRQPPLKRHLTTQIGALRDHSCSQENMCDYDQETIELGGQDEDGDDDDDDDDDDEEEEDDDEEQAEYDEYEDEEENSEEYHDDGHHYDDNDDDEDDDDDDDDVWRGNEQEKEHFMPEVRCHDYSQSSRDHSYLKEQDSCELEEYCERDYDESAALAPAKLTKSPYWHHKQEEKQEYKRKQQQQQQHSRRLLPFTNPLKSHHHQQRQQQQQQQQQQLLHYHQHEHNKNHQHRIHPPHPPGQHELDSAAMLHHRHKHRHRHTNLDFQPPSQTDTDQQQQKQQAHRFQCQVAHHHQHHHLDHHHSNQHNDSDDQQKKLLKMPDISQRRGIAQQVSPSHSYQASNLNPHLLAGSTQIDSLVGCKYSPTNRSPSQLDLQARSIRRRSKSQSQTRCWCNSWSLSRSCSRSRHRSRVGLETKPTSRDAHLSSCSCSWLSLSSNAVSKYQTKVDNCSQCLVLGAKGLMIHDQEQQQQLKEQLKEQRQQNVHRFRCNQQDGKFTGPTTLVGQQLVCTGSPLDTSQLSLALVSSANKVSEQSQHQQQQKEIDRVIPSLMAGKCQQLVSSPPNNDSIRGHLSGPSQITSEQYLQGRIVDPTHEPTLSHFVAATSTTMASAPAPASNNTAASTMTTTTTITATTTTNTTKQAIPAIGGKRESLPTFSYVKRSRKNKNNYELCCKSFSSLAQSPTYIQTATTDKSKWLSTGHQDQLSGGNRSARNSNSNNKRARTLPKLVCKCCCQHLECIEHALQSKSTTCQGKQQARDGIFEDKGGHKLRNTKMKKEPTFSVGIPGSKSFNEGVNVTDDTVIIGPSDADGPVGEAGGSSGKLVASSLSESLSQPDQEQTMIFAQSRGETTNDLKEKEKVEGQNDEILATDQRTEIFSIEAGSAKLFKHKEKQTHSD